MTNRPLGCDVTEGTIPEHKYRAKNIDIIFSVLDLYYFELNVLR